MGKGAETDKSFNLRSSSSNLGEAPTTTQNNFDELKILIQGTNVKIDSMRQDMANNYKQLKNSIDNIQSQVSDHSKQISALQEENEKLKIEASERDKKLEILDNLIDDQVNRSLRNTLVFRNIERKATEKTWNDCRHEIAEVIAKHCNMYRDDIVSMIERAHRGQKAQSNSDSSNISNIYVRFFSWRDSEYIKSSIINVNKRNKNFINVSQMYSKKTTENFNKALTLRKTLKVSHPENEYVVRYPGKLFFKNRESKGPYKEYVDE